MTKYYITSKTHWFINQKDQFNNVHLAQKVEFLRETAKAVLVRWSDFGGGVKAGYTMEMWIPKSCLSTTPEATTKREATKAAERKQYPTHKSTSRYPSDTELLIRSMGKMAASTIDLSTEYGKAVLANAKAEYDARGEY